MPIDQKDVLPAVVVIVDELSRPGEEGIGRRGDAQLRADLGKALVAAILGFGSLAGLAAEAAKILFVVFLVLFVFSLFFRGRTPRD